MVFAFHASLSIESIRHQFGRWTWSLMQFRQSETQKKMKCWVCKDRHSLLSKCIGCVKPILLCAEHQRPCIHCGEEGPFCSFCSICEACGEDSPGQDACVSCAEPLKPDDKKFKCIDCMDWYSCSTCTSECTCGLSAIKHYVCKEDVLHKCHHELCKAHVCELAAREHTMCPTLGSLRYCHEHRIK